MIREIEDAIIRRIEESGIEIKKVVNLQGSIEDVWKNEKIWPAVVVGYERGNDEPQTSKGYRTERIWNIFILVKNLRGRQGNLYDILDSMREIFSGDNLGLDFVDIIHPTVDEAIYTDFNRTIWVLKIKVIGWR